MATAVLLTFENLEEAIMQEIADKAMAQRDVAQTYAILIHQCGPDGANWARINRAIMDRWGASGLERIKRLAWTLLQRRGSRSFGNGEGGATHA